MPLEGKTPPVPGVLIHNIGTPRWHSSITEKLQSQPISKLCVLSGGAIYFGCLDLKCADICDEFWPVAHVSVVHHGEV